MTTWREHCSAIIAGVIDRVGKGDESNLRKELRKAYPYGDKSHWPYKVWLSEIKRQLQGPKKPKPKPVDPNQLDLFCNQVNHE